MKGVTTGRPVSDKLCRLRVRTQKRYGDSAGSTHAFRGAESASRNLHNRNYRKKKEKCSVPVR